jgi:hypothetical protein
MSYKRIVLVCLQSTEKTFDCIRGMHNVISKFRLFAFWFIREFTQFYNRSGMIGIIKSTDFLHLQFTIPHLNNLTSTKMVSIF